MCKSVTTTAIGTLRAASRAESTHSANMASTCQLYFFKDSRCAFKTSCWSSTKSMFLIVIPNCNGGYDPRYGYPFSLRIDERRGNLYSGDIKSRSHRNAADGREARAR